MTEQVLYTVDRSPSTLYVDKYALAYEIATGEALPTPASRDGRQSGDLVYGDGMADLPGEEHIRIVGWQR